MLPVPHRTQLIDGYCLPACVQMVLAYWGTEVTQEKLARQLKTIPNAGTPGSRLRLLSSRRLDVMYGTGTLAELRLALKQGIPPIALIHTGQLRDWNSATAHAVVVVDIDADIITLNDPGMSTSAQTKLGDFHLAWDAMDNLFALIRKK